MSDTFARPTAPAGDPSTEGIPILDLRRWHDGDAAQRSLLADEVDRHLQRLGFLVVINHGIDPTVMSSCRSAALDFFHQAPEAKQRVAVGEYYRGWVGPGLESNAATYGIDTPPDSKETYAYGPVEVPDPSLVSTAPRWFAPNVWPDDVPDFRPAAEAWWRSARRLTDQLLEILATGLGLPVDFLTDACSATTASVSLNWYWSRNHDEPTDGQFRIGPHTDFGTLTILDREPGAGGLQVRDENGRWMDAPVVEGGLIVNTGDMIRQWSNDRWSSNEHRVLPPPASAPDEELLSLVFFHEPNHDTMIEPLPTTIGTDRVARYEPILASDYLAAKMDALEVP